MCLQNNSLKTILRVATGVPLLTGIIIIIAVSVSLIELNATKWMVPVVKSLEKEETESLQRLAIAQAGFAEEIMEQMLDEANMAQDFATKILNKDFVATNNVMPEGGYQFTLPVSLTEVNKLQYDMTLIEQSPPPNSNVCSQIQNQNVLKNCWFDPEIPLTAGRVVEGAGQVTSAEKLTISLKTTGIYWPHPRATGKMGPSQGGAAGNCEGGKGTPCVPDPAYEFRDVKNLDSALLEEIKLTSYVSELFQQIFLSNEAIEFMYIGTHGHGVFRTFPYGHSAGRVTKDRKSARDGITRSGYDPRHRPWYWQCEQAGKTMVTPPYVDATTDELVITVSTPIYDNNNKLLAVVGYDVSIARLAQIVLSAKVLQHGYAYLVTADQGYKYEEYGKPNIEDAGKLVVYPGLAAADIDSGNTQLIRWEFKSANDFEATAFVNGIYKRLIDPLTVPSLGTYNKSDDLWHIAYAPVKTPKYTLAFVVPDTDIRLPATQVEKLIASIVETQVGIFIAMVVVSSLIFIWMQVEVAHFVVLPVQSLTRVIDLIIRDIARDEADARQPNKRRGGKKNRGEVGRFELHVNDLIKPEDEGCKEVSMMKESFEHMLMALRFGSESAAKNDLKSAFMIYDEARNMFKSLSNVRGEGIATFNLGVISHKIWLQSEKQNMRAYADAENFYKLSIDNGNEIWNSLLNNNGKDDEEFVVPINPGGIELQTRGEGQQSGKGQPMAVAPIMMDPIMQQQSSDDSARIDEDQDVRIPKRLIGNDMADKLAARLHHYSQLLVDTAQLDKYKEAKIMLEQALMLDTITNNLLGYSARVGLYGEVLFGLGQYQLAETKVMGQLNILRNRVAMFEHAELTAERLQGMDRAELKRSKSQYQEEEELFQAFQNGLIDAATMMANDPQKRHDMQALSLFKEALSCSQRTKKYTIAQIFIRMEAVVNRNFERLSVKFCQSYAEELAKNKGATGGGNPKDVIFVVDYSGSMSGGKIRRAREGITSVVKDHMYQGMDKAAVIRFNSSVTTMCELTGDKDKLYDIIANLSNPSRATALWDGLGAAIEMLKEGSINNKKVDSWIVCVSDGEDNKSKKFTPAQVGNLIKRLRINIVILSVGVTEKQALDDMRHVANSNADKCIGEIIEISSSSEIDEAFANIGSIVGQNLDVQHY